MSLCSTTRMIRPAIRCNRVILAGSALGALAWPPVVVAPSRMTWVVRARWQALTRCRLKCAEGQTCRNLALPMRVTDGPRGRRGSKRRPDYVAGGASASWAQELSCAQGYFQPLPPQGRSKLGDRQESRSPDLA